MTDSAHIFTGQGFDNSQISDYSKSKYFSEVSEHYFRVFDTKLPPSGDLDDKNISHNEISAAILCMSSLEKMDFAKDFYDAPTYIAGYSVGQYLAIHHAGCISREDLISIVFNRCKIMNQAASKCKATLVAVLGLPLPKIETLIYETKFVGKIHLSNDNAIGNYTFAVTLSHVEEFMDLCMKAGAYRVKCLNTTGGWHSEFMTSALPAFKTALDELDFLKSSNNLIDNTYVSEKRLELENIQNTLCEHLIRPVRWRETIKYFANRAISNVFEISDFDLLTRIGTFSSRKTQFISLGSL